jgi:OmcA/MtrC family decaheme c-type cytochrome
MHFYPQELTYCRTCHDNQAALLASYQPANRAAADKTAWRDNISAQNCSTCHKTFNPATHFGVQTDNSKCTLCHNNTDGVAKVADSHVAPKLACTITVSGVTSTCSPGYPGCACTGDAYSTPNSPEMVKGAKILQYEISSLTLNASRQPVVKFRVQYKDSASDTTWKNLDLKSDTPFADGSYFGSRATPNNIGGLAFLVATSGPSPASAAGPAITAAADFNNAGLTTSGREYFGNGDDFTSSWGKRAFDQPVSYTVNTIRSTLSAMDASGYHTVTLPTAYPANSTLRMVAIESYLTINGLNISADAKVKGVDSVASTARRGATNAQACLLCHERLGFHSNSGRVNNPDHCVMCHNAEMTSSNTFSSAKTGKCVKPDATTGGKPFTAVAKNADGTCPSTAYEVEQKPMNLKDMLHFLHGGAMTVDKFNFLRSNPNSTTGGANAYNFEHVSYPGELADCKSCHSTDAAYDLPLNANALSTVYDAFPGLTTTLPSSQGLMTRKLPTQAACGSCHDSTDAKVHFATNTIVGTGEACDTCHAVGRDADVVQAHSKRYQ